MKDILIDNNNDLRLSADGDFEIGYSDNQQQKAILTTEMLIEVKKAIGIRRYAN